MKNNKVDRRQPMTIEHASAIVNDIHEGLCRASRKELMECASVFSLRCCELYQEARTAYMAQTIAGFKGAREFEQKYSGLTSSVPTASPSSSRSPHSGIL